MTTQTTIGVVQRTTDVMAMRDPYRVNSVTAAVASMRRLEDVLTPAQQAVREQGRARVEALQATGLYSLARRS